MAEKALRQRTLHRDEATLSLAGLAATYSPKS